MSTLKDERAKMEHIIGECFVKAANVILSSRISQTSRSLPKTATSKRSWVSPTTQCYCYEIYEVYIHANLLPICQMGQS